MEKFTSRRKNIASLIKKNQFENIAWHNNEVVCGIDEVGRGCLAGPLVAAAVIIPPHTSYRYLKDSKIMSEADRLKAYRWIMLNCTYGIGIVPHNTIDTIAIWNATLLAMKKGLLSLLSTNPTPPTMILIDAMPLQLHDTSFKTIPIKYFPKGESLSISIAAASIVAKVTRDQLMVQFDAIFPGYGMAQHKGYGTTFHRKALIKNGPTIIHRTSFLNNIYPLIANTRHKKKESHHEHQQSIC